MKTRAARYSIWRHFAPLAMAIIAPLALHAQATGFSVSPNNGTGTSQLFTFHAYGYVSQMLLLVANSTNGVDGQYACYIQFARAANQVYLTDNMATTWGNGGALGSSTPLSNSQCSINLAQSNINGTSGNDLYLNLAIAFTPNTNFPASSKYVYEYTVDNAGQITNWEWVGLWTIGASPLAPDSVTPSSGGGATQTFTFTGSSPNGSSYISQYHMLFNWNVDGAGACWLQYLQSGNSLYLINDTGSAWLGPYAPGSANTLSNSQCSVNVASVTVSGFSNTLVLTVPITFNSSFIGPQNAYGYVADQGGNASGWQYLGSWTGYAAPSTQPPSGLFILPGTGTGASQTFILHANDPNGYAYMPQMLLLFNPLNTPTSQVSGAAACYIYYERAAASISLINDAGTAWLGPVALGSSTVLSNNQCSINAAQSASTGNGNDLYLYLAVTFTAAYDGQKSTYEWVVDHADQVVGWSQIGSWNVNAPTLVTTSPLTGLQLTVDGVACTTPCTYGWSPTSNHTVSAPTLQSGAPGAQYSFASWSDGGTQSHSITVGSGTGTYTANVSPQYYLTTSAGSGGTISPQSGWYAGGSVVQAVPSPNSEYQFSGFQGALSGTAAPQSLLMNQPTNVVATFNPHVSFATQSPLPGGTASLPYSFTFQATGGVPPYGFGLTTSLPPGLSFLQNGTISGTPTGAVTNNYGFIVYDSTGNHASGSFQLAIAPGQGAPIAGCSASPGSPSPGQTVTFTATVFGGYSPYQYSWSGGWVSGTAVNASFTPQTSQPYSATVTVTDHQNQTSSKSCSVTVSPAPLPLTITSSSTLPNGTAGTSYSQALSATGGSGGYTWSLLSGSVLPPGISLSSSGQLSGSPTTTGTFEFVAVVTDGSNHQATAALWITITSSTPQGSVQVSLAAPQIGASYGPAVGATIVPLQFVFHFTDPLGRSDIAGGQIIFGPYCQLDWNVGGNLNITGLAWGSFGGATLSSTYCNVYGAASTLTPTAQGYDVSVSIGFTSQFPYQSVAISARGTSVSGGTGAYGAAVGSWGVANPAAGSIAIPQFLSDGGEPPSCGGGLFIGSYVNNYADGTIEAGDFQYVDDTGNATLPWTNSILGGLLLGPSSLIIENSGPSASTLDSDPAILTIGPSSPGQPSGGYVVTGNYQFQNPSCIIYLDPGDIFAEGSGTSTVYFPSYVSTFNVAPSSADPSPFIWSITVSPALAAGGTAQLIVDGNNFGTVSGGLTICHSFDQPSCDQADVTATVNNWTTGQILATLSAAGTASGSYDVQLTSAATGYGFQSNGQTNPNARKGAFPVTNITVSQSPNTLNMSSGDTNKTVTTTVTPSSVQFTPTITWGSVPSDPYSNSYSTSNNPFSNCAAGLVFQNPTGTGTVMSGVTANSPNGCGSPSGMFNVLSSANGVGTTDGSTTLVIVPPQVLIQQMWGAAYGYSDPKYPNLDPNQIVQRSVGMAVVNRFTMPSNFLNLTTYQAMAASGKIEQSSIPYGPPIIIDNAAAVFSLQIPDPTGGSTCYWSPRATEWVSILAAFKSGTTILSTDPNNGGLYSIPKASQGPYLSPITVPLPPMGILDPECFFNSGSGSGTQIVWKVSMPLNPLPGMNPAPAFLFERQRTANCGPNGNQLCPAVVQIP